MRRLFDGRNLRVVPAHRSLLTAFLLVLAAAPLPAQQDSLSLAFSLERRGDVAAALDIYQAVLSRRPSEAAALLGLERCLGVLNRSAELIPPVQAAIAANPNSPVLDAIAVRAWAAGGQPDSVARYAERWAQLVPDEEQPYREWGAALQALRDLEGARRAYLRGRERLGSADALAPELAQVAIMTNDYPAALQEWLRAVARLPGYRSSAVTTLARAPAAVRPELLRTLERDPTPTGRSLTVELRARWGDPVGGARTLIAGLPGDTAQAADALQGFVLLCRGLSGRPARQAQGMALEALAAYRSPSTRPRLWLEAAQVYAEAGDAAAARRLLAELASDSAAAPLRVGVATTLISVLVQDGAVAEAGSRLEEIKADLPPDDYLRLRHEVSEGWIRAGDLDHAEALVQADSSVDGLALAGRIRLYRGALADARILLKEAGPYAGTREEATARSGLLALLQVVKGDSLPALGAALLALNRADTAAAIQGLERVAAGQPATGAAALSVLAGRLAAAQGHAADAERLFRAARSPEAPASAAEAELELGRLLVSLNRLAEATEPLEHLILSYPESALVPQARQLLNVARGVVPRT
jgi:tetratricopeptide (TPR) repeat protein